jgi:hypothetical protein
MSPFLSNLGRRAVPNREAATLQAGEDGPAGDCLKWDEVLGVATVGIADLALRPLMRNWGRRALRSLASVPRPVDDPRAHASGVDTDRVLLFGSGAAVGWGVLSHAMALPGSLARALSGLTGRGTDVDTLPNPEFRVSSALKELRGVNLTRYDAIVLSLGLNEIVSLGSVASWRRDLEALVDYLEEHSAVRTPMFIIGINPMTQITRLDAMLGPFISHHRRTLNGIASRLGAHRERVFFIPNDPPARTEQNRYRTASEYRAGGIAIAARVAPVLDADLRDARSGFERRARTAVTDELDRIAALEAAGITETEEQRYDRLTEFARRSFRTSAAKLTILDADAFWTKSAQGMPRLAGPLDDSICFTAADSEDALVIGDVSLDPRFASMPHVKGPPPVRFYAGHRIEGPDGVPIAVLCVQDSKPRDVTGFDRALLRDLALLVQKEVWVGSTAVAMGFEADTVSPVSANPGMLER